jgi:tRNA pseudouridine13 synthase
LPGKGGATPSGAVLELERAVVEQWSELVTILAALGVEASRRALRLCPGALEWAFEDGDLHLAFTLPPGAYATTVLREIFVTGDTG